MAGGTASGTRFFAADGKLRGDIDVRWEVELLREESIQTPCAPCSSWEAFDLMPMYSPSPTGARTPFQVCRTTWLYVARGVGSGRCAVFDTLQQPAPLLSTGRRGSKTSEPSHASHTIRLALCQCAPTDASALPENTAAGTAAMIVWRRRLASIQPVGISTSAAKTVRSTA